MVYEAISDSRKERWKALLLLLRILLLLPILTCLNPVSCYDDDRCDGVAVSESNFLALQAFKQELIDPKGFLQSWNGTGYDACSGAWVGIKCAKGHVIVIQLPWKGLQGRITNKLSQLQALRKLSLHSNKISGSIPLTLGLLPNLRGLQLFNNRLSGSIPLSLGYCPLLQSLDLSNNFLTGTIPIEIGKLSKLRILDFSNNLLNGTLPHTLSSLHNLSVLILSRNRLIGHIPESISKISTLTHVDLSLNNLSGEIPVSFDYINNLNLFNVSYNSLSGTVPSLLAERFNTSSFVGNIQLCGYSSSTQCPSLIPSEQVIFPSPSKHHYHRKLSSKDMFLIAVGAFLLFMITLCCILLFFLIKKRAKLRDCGRGTTTPVRREKGVPPIASGEVEEGGGEAGGKLVHFDGSIGFTADDLLCATAEIMGKSTYGTVYKATLEDGSQVAVKRLREKITKSQREFEAEVCVLGKIRHPNLLPLRAYYLGPKGEKLLVFDYMPNGSLASFLHDNGPEIVIEWPTRMKIAQKIAAGLFHLHSNENIIHGNLTSNNVLVDENLDVKVADFGLSKLMITAVNSNVLATAGALGYRAPELSKLKNANTKTDIYSFGVILLELLTRKSPAEGVSMNSLDLPKWVASNVKEEWTNEVFVVELMRVDATIVHDELLNTLKLALHCVDPSPSARPEAQQVLQQLQEIRPERSIGSRDDFNTA